MKQNSKGVAVKVLKLIGSALAAFWALGCVYELLFKTLPDRGGPFFISELLGGLAGMVVATMICIGLIRSALRQPAKSEPE